eukprot:254727-Chlamydomonas_euryale.AAC.3
MRECRWCCWQEDNAYTFMCAPSGNGTDMLNGHSECDVERWKDSLLEHAHEIEETKLMETKCM